VDDAGDEVWGTVALYGGPLDGGKAYVCLSDPDPGTALAADGLALPGGRAWYAPDAQGRWTWRGATS
jgi:hypothetical protein